MYKNNMFDEDLTVEFQGGNISMLKEVDALIEEFKSHNCKHFHILMNGLKYIPILEKIANQTTCEICIALDCGTKETF